MSATPQTSRLSRFGSLRDLDGNPPSFVAEHPTGEVRLRLTEASRRLNELLLTREADASEVAELAEALEAAVERLADRPERQPELWEYNQTVGLLNVLTPVLRADPDPDDPSLYRCRATFTKANEGVNGTVHGGMLAMVLDNCAGSATGLSGTPALTGTLSIRYERPAPIYTELTFFSKVSSVEGRKIFVNGGVLNGDELCVRFDAVMFGPKSS